MISTAEAAKRAGVHKDTLLRWLRRGLVREPTRDRHGWRHFTEEEVMKVVAYARSEHHKDAQPEELSENASLQALAGMDWDFAGAKTNYLTHRLHPYPAKFIPQIPNALIQELSRVGDTVGDIFCGSGTTLVESLTLKRNAVGVDASPLACLIAKAKTTLLTEDGKQELVCVLKRVRRMAEHAQASSSSGLPGILSSAWRPDFPKLSFWFDDFIIEELAEALQLCRGIESPEARTVALASFSSIVVTVSRQDSDTRYVRREKGTMPGDAFKRFARALEQSIEVVSELTDIVEPRFSCTIVEQNLLLNPDVPMLDLVVCSPPYPNAFSYHLYHMTRMIWLGMDQPRFKAEEIGSHRKYSKKGAGAATVETFQKEFANILSWLGGRLKRGKYACFVVGDSTLSGKRVSNADVISEAGRVSGFHEVARIDRHMQATKKILQSSHWKDQDGTNSRSRTHRPQMSNFVCRIKDYIQPFERNLAFQEVGTLLQSLGLKAERISQVELKIFGNEKDISTFVERLAYWESIEGQGQSITTLQSLREATVNVVRNGIDLDVLRSALPFRDEVSLPNRRCLRYGTHGIHEYRGKFFPQLVRALINVSGTDAGGIVADPMSGSGTTMVESKLFGCESYGVDMNPLSCLLTETKASLLEANPDELIDGYRAVREALLKPEPRSQKIAYFENLPKDDQRYLSAWFGTEVLAALDDIMRLILKENSIQARGLMLVAVSNILRSVSWQKVEDLRVRKEVRLDVEIDPKKEFLEELGRSVRAVLALLYQEGRKDYPKHTIVQGDARRCAEMWPTVKGRVDTIITSPPYATALPYLDTDRLSLCYLGLLPRPEHRARDLLMIGNREVSEKMRREYLATYQAEKTSLPEAITGLIDKIDDLNSNHKVGFRRRNLSALLFKYFSDMKRVIHSMNDALRVGGTAYIVVGNNHTTAGGERVNIETAQLLATLADQAGFVVEPSLSMDMLASRDIFRKNAMATEEILYLRKAS